MTHQSHQLLMALTVAVLEAALAWRPGALPPAVRPEPPPPPTTVVVPARRLILAGANIVLPEGTYLLRSPGRVFVDPKAGGWRFLPADFGNSLNRAIPIAPSEPLADIAQATIGEAGLAVEFTGEVLQYRGSNWLLPELIVVLDGAPPAPRADDIDIVMPDERTPSEDLDAGTSTIVDGAAPPADPNGPRGESAEATEILRRLTERVGAVPRSSARLAQTDGTTPPRGAVWSASEGAALDPARGATTPRRVAEQLVRRRGVLVRDNDRGGWRFVSATEDGSSPESSLRVVPSQSLQQLESLVRSSDGPVPVLFSGQVLRFRNEGWLRIVEFSLPRTGKTLTPGAR